MSSFSRLIRFVAKNGQVHYGDAILPPGVTDIAETKKARVITGNIFGQYNVTDEVAEVERLLAPLAPEETRTVRCLGPNYKAHGSKDTKYPILFYKPTTALAGPKDPIPVHKLAQEDGLDYECELVVVIKKACLNVPESQALDYVLGYAVGNDVSHRPWQQRGGGQYSLGKMFDGWAPYGPGLVSPSLITDPQTLRLTTRVNGRTVQHSNTGEMIFNVKQQISFFSQGTTLLPGDVIFTGTPAKLEIKNPQEWLKQGDVVEVEAGSIGICTNRVKFV